MRFVFITFGQIDLHSESQHTFSVGWSSPKIGAQASRLATRGAYTNKPALNDAFNIVLSPPL